MVKFTFPVGDGIEQSPARDNLNGGYEMFSRSIAYARLIDGSLVWSL